MTVIAIISILLSLVLAVLLWYTDKVNRQANMELLKRIPTADGTSPSAEVQPLTVDKIADAIRMEGYFPEKEGNLVSFKAQGEGYYVDTDRLPMFFLVKWYNVDPTAWDMDILRAAAHKMSDDLVMVKAGVSEDDKTLNFFIAAQDRNYESFRANLVYYLHILNDGQQKLAQEYNLMVEEKKNAVLPDNPASSSKIMS
jgi:hypothetical protein